MSKITEKEIKNCFNGITEAGNKELKEMSQADLERYWLWKWNPNQSKEVNTYKFFDLLELYSHFCRRWEEMHNGHGCVVERVRDRYLMPKIKIFVAEISTK